MKFSFKIKISIPDMYSKTHTAKKAIKFGITCPNRMKNIYAKLRGNLLRSEEFVHTFPGNEVTAFCMLICHQSVLRDFNQQEDHTEFFGNHLLPQFGKFYSRNRRGTEVLLFDMHDTIWHRRPDYLSNSPVARIIKHQNVLDTTVQKSLHA